MARTLAQVIDLHTHSSASDGTDSPAQLVAAAHARGITVLGVTDHDTTAGWHDAALALPPGMTLVPGAEFSCMHADSDGRPIGLHLLGYLFDPRAEPLQSERRRLRASRLSRGRAIVDRMVADGVPVRWEQVSALAAGGPVGRPHIGRALVHNGVVTSVDEAFRGPLNSSSPYYVRKADTDVLAAIAMVRAAGGICVFAHPLARRRGRVVGDEVVAAMVTAGLGGIEVDHPDHAPADRAHLRGLAAELGVLATGSSDYHGTNKPTPLAACTTEPAAYEALVAGNTACAPIVLSA